MKKKILIIEENQEFIGKLGEVTDIFGYPLQIEKSFESGLTYLKENNCAAVIQEIVIANKINMELIKVVKMEQTSQNFEIPIAIMNDSMSQEYAQNMKKKLSGVIHKPFEVSTFVQVVKLIIAIDFLRKLIARLKALEEYEEVIKISGVADAIKEAVQMIKGFLEEDKEFTTVACGESIEEVLTMVLGEPLPPEATQVVKALEVESTETFQLLGEKNLEPISKQTVPGVLDLDETKINVGNGLQKEGESKTVVGGSQEEDKSETTVSGSDDQDDHSQSISGATNHISEENILDRQNRDGQTYCMLAAGKGDIEEVKRIVEEGADITLRSKDGRNMLHWSARGGNLELVEFFIEKGVDHRFKDNKGNLPVVHAIRCKHTEIAKLLLDKMKNFRWINANGQSLVMEAAFAGNDEILKVLLDKGAPINLKDNKHRSAFWYAKKKKHKSTMALLIKNGLSA